MLLTGSVKLVLKSRNCLPFFEKPLTSDPLATNILSRALSTGPPSSSLVNLVPGSVLKAFWKFEIKLFLTVIILHIRKILSFIQTIEIVNVRYRHHSKFKWFDELPSHLSQPSQWDFALLADPSIYHTYARTQWLLRSDSMRLNGLTLIQ